MDSDNFDPDQYLAEKTAGYNPDSVLQDVVNQSPALKNRYSNDMPKVVFADDSRNQLNKQYGGGGGLEWWPKEEDGAPEFPHPLKGKQIAMEVYDKDLQSNPEALKKALYGDLLHGMVKDPKWAQLRDEFSKNFTPESLNMLKREGRPLNDSVVDGWIRGYLSPDKNDEFRKNQASGQNTWSPKQMEILGQMENYLKGSNDNSFDPDQYLAEKTGQVPMTDAHKAFLARNAMPKGEFAPDTGMEMASGRSASNLYGGLQALGEIPEGVAQIALRTFPGVQLLSSVSPKFNESISNATKPISDLTPKAFKAAGFDQNDPNSPTMQYPENALVGELGVNVAPGVVEGGVGAYKGAGRMISGIAKEANEAALAEQGRALQIKARQLDDNVTATAEFHRDAQLGADKEALLKAKSENDAAIKARQDFLNSESVQSYHENVQKALDLKSQYPTPLDPNALGAQTSETIEKSAEASKKDYTKAYRDVGESAGSEKIKMEFIPDALDKLREEQLSGNIEGLKDFRLESAAKETSIGKQIEKLSSSDKKAYNALETPEQKSNFLKSRKNVTDWDSLQTDFRNVNSKLADAKKAKDGNAMRVFGNIKDAIQNEMSNFADKVGGETKDLFEVANKKFQDHQNTFETSNIRGITTDKMLQNPSAVADKVTGSSSPDYYKNLKKIIPDNEFKDIQSGHLNDMMSPHKDAPFDPNHFIKQYEGMTHSELEAVYGKEGAEAVRSLYKESKSISQINDINKLVKEAAQSSSRDESLISLHENANAIDAAIESNKSLGKSNSSNDRLKALKLENNRLIEDMQRLQSGPPDPKMFSKLGMLLTAYNGAHMVAHPLGGLLRIGGSAIKGNLLRSMRDPKNISKLIEMGNTSSVGRSRQLAIELTKDAAISSEDDKQSSSPIYISK